MPGVPLPFAFLPDISGATEGNGEASHQKH